MISAIKRPKGIKRPAPGLINRDALKVTKRSRIQFVPFGSGYPGVRPNETSRGPLNATFKADVESLLEENAELLRRLAQ